MFLAGLAVGLLVPSAAASGILFETEPCDLNKVACASFELPKMIPLAERFAAYRKPRAGGNRPYWRRNLFKRIGSDQVYLMTTWWPQEFQRVSFVLPIALSGVVAARSDSGPDSLDREVSRWFTENTTPNTYRLATDLTELANRALLLVGGSYVISRLAGAERAERATSLSGEALINGALYVAVLKRLMRRTRPAAGGTGAFFHEEVPHPGGNNSFPSGHSTGAFAVATVVSHEYRDKGWVPWVAYGTASMVALSRVSLGRHFPTDVVVGALLGNSIGRMVCHRADVSRGEESKWSRFQPGINAETGGVEIVYRHTW